MHLGHAVDQELAVGVDSQTVDLLLSGLPNGKPGGLNKTKVYGTYAFPRENQTTA